MREFMQRDFGIKDLHKAARKRFECRIDTYCDFEKYNYLLQTHKRNIDYNMSMLVEKVRFANSIRPRLYTEYELRRNYQNEALAFCDVIVGELQEVVETFAVDINKFEPYIKGINREIDLIKGWRQKDNRFKTLPR
nr:MAG TPA: hypothetical protein [Caudoviricetes sp.]